MGCEGCINVLYASDNGFSDILGVSLQSLLSTTKQTVSVYVVSESITAKNKENLFQVCASFHQYISFIDMPSLSTANDQKIDIGRYSISMFSRFMVDTLLPRDIHRLIYLDCDTLVVQDISMLWSLELSGKTMGAMNDLRSSLYCKNLGMEVGGCYVNSGVLLIDLDRYRELKLESILLEGVIKYNGLLEFPDNDILCKTLAQEIIQLPHQFNAISLLYSCSFSELRRMRHPSHMITKSAYEDAVVHPAIVHFTSCVSFKSRPWEAQCNHPMVNLFLEIRAQTPWANMPLRKNEMRLKKRFVLAFSSKCPRRLFVFVMGITHAYIKPIWQFFTKRRYSKVFHERLMLNTKCNKS